MKGMRDRAERSGRGVRGDLRIKKHEWKLKKKLESKNNQ